MAITIDFTDPEQGLKTLLSHLPDWGTTKGDILLDTDYVRENIRFGKYHRNTEQVFQYSKRKQKWGYILSVYDVGHYVSIKLQETTPIEVKWEKSWRRVLKYLEESGLFTDYKENVKLALEIGYETINKACSIDNKRFRDIPYADARQLALEEIKALEPRLIKFSEEYQNEYYNTEILWYMSRPAKIKTMYFGKYHTERIRKELAEAMANKEKYYASKTVGYDNSVSYDPERNTLAYNEEYRGCGNGHYYLGLNSTHAVFYEDD